MNQWFARRAAAQSAGTIAIRSVDVRRRLVEGLGGVVLDVGVGSWPALEFYGRSVSLIGVESRVDVLPDAHRIAQQARSGRACVVGGRAERLPIATGAVDHVVVAFVLCSVTSVEQTLREIVRVLRPGGTFMFVEHVPVRGLRWWRQRFADLPPAVRRRGGCHQRRDPRSAIVAAFDSVELAEQAVTRRNGEPSRVAVGRARRGDR